MRMVRNKVRVVLTTAGILIAFAAGCAGNGRALPEWRALATFGDAQSVPKIVVYGDFAAHLPRFNPTPALDEFLYGPAPVPHSILRNPQGLTMLGDKLLVCDQGYPDIISLNLANGLSTGWEERDRAPRCPVAIDVGEDGTVYVADTTLRAVLIYDGNGRFIEQLVPPQQTNPYFRPSSVLLRDRILYIGNVGDHRVERWNLAERQWMSPIVPPADRTGFMAPTGLAMTSDNVLLILDSIRSRVFRFSPEGEWLKPIGRPGRLEGEFVRPKQMGITPSGLLFIADAGRQSVMVFTAEGDFLLELRERPDEWRGFTLPTGILPLAADALDVLAARGVALPEPKPDEWVIVSDTLNASSLNLLGVYLPDRTEAPTDEEK